MYGPVRQSQGVVLICQSKRDPASGNQIPIPKPCFNIKAYTGFTELSNTTVFTQTMHTLIDNLLRLLRDRTTGAEIGLGENSVEQQVNGTDPVVAQITHGQRHTVSRELASRDESFNRCRRVIDLIPSIAAKDFHQARTLSCFTV